MIVWLIGMSGSGKTTISEQLFLKMKQKLSNVVWLDGDVLRQIWGDDLGHDLESRHKNAKRISSLCKLMDDQGIHVIASVISLFPDWQKWNRENFKNYFQIHLNPSLSLLKKRDNKNIYARAEKGQLKNVAGIDLIFPEPFQNDLVLSDEGLSDAPEKIAQDIWSRLNSRLV